MHFTTTLVFDSGFYSDAVSFSVLMEIFAKHKTSSVFLKVEFGLKKINYFSRNENSKELRFNEKKLRLSIFKIKMNSFIIFK